MTTAETCPPCYSILEEANGAWSKGVCKKCGKETWGRNSIDTGMTLLSREGGTTLGFSQSKFGKTEYPQVESAASARARHAAQQRWSKESD